MASETHTYTPRYEDADTLATHRTVVYFRHMQYEGKLCYQAIVCTGNQKPVTYNNMGHSFLSHQGKLLRSSLWSIRRLLTTYDAFVLETNTPILLTGRERDLESLFDKVHLYEGVVKFVPAGPAGAVASTATKGGINRD